MNNETNSLLGQRWIVRNPEPIPESLAALPYPQAIKRLLLARGLRSLDEIESFLKADLHSLGDPLLLSGMHEATERVVRAIRSSEKIGVFGDYDVDGQTATTLMLKVLTQLGATVEAYIPHRLEEGYGLNIDALASMKSSGCQLIITVDCGITSVEEARWAKSNGLDLIITDHHEPGHTLPNAVSIVNPKLDDRPELADLAGCGVAFKLAEAVAQSMGAGRETVHTYVDLVALGTVADVVPLLHENRALVRAGLAAINDGKALPGIRALCDVAGVKAPIRSGHIGFTIAPRLNAVGRIGDAGVGLKLLMASTYDEALPLARELDRANAERQSLEAAVVDEARAVIERHNMAQAKGLVLCEKGWHVGVVGIAASRIAEAYYRPTVLLTVEDDVARGSARSIPGFDLYSALETCSDLFESFGGHTSAAGLTLPLEHVDTFRRRFAEVASERLSDDDLQPMLEIDGLLSVDEITLEWIETLSLLEPYGMGNPTPVFASRDVWVEARPVGKEQQHLKFGVAVSGNSPQRVDGIGFGLASQLGDYVVDGSYQDIAYTVDINEWNGMRKPSLRIRDLRTVSADHRPAARLLHSILSSVMPSTTNDGREFAAGAVGESYVAEKVDLLHNVMAKARRVVVFAGEHKAVLSLALRLSQEDSKLKGAVFAWDETVSQSHAGELEETLGSDGWVAVCSDPVPASFRSDAVIIWDLPLDPRLLVGFLQSAAVGMEERRPLLAFTARDVDRLRRKAGQDLPDRDQLRRVYVAIRELAQTSRGVMGQNEIVGAVTARWPGLLSQEGIVRSIRIFAELGLLVREHDVLRWQPLPGDKVDLEASLLYNECNLLRTKLWHDTDSDTANVTFVPEELMNQMFIVAQRLNDHYVGRSVS